MVVGFAQSAMQSASGVIVLQKGLFNMSHDHPHYAASQPRTAPSGGEVGPEVDKARLKALEAFWEFVVDTQPYVDALDVILAKARALLPEPVDADLVIVRQMVADGVRGKWPDQDVERLLAGSRDKDPSIQVPLACLKRGRALEKGEAA